jgi:hypothetical protein
MDIHPDPFIKGCFMGFLGGLESMFQLLEWLIIIAGSIYPACRDGVASFAI